MSAQKIPVNRTLVGVIALACLVIAALIWATQPSVTNASRSPASNPDMWQGAFTRVGLLMAAFWLALPSRQRDAAWASVSPQVLLGILAALFVVARFRWAVIPILVGVAIVAVLLRPRGKRRPPRAG